MADTERQTTDVESLLEKLEIILDISTAGFMVCKKQNKTKRVTLFIKSSLGSKRSGKDVKQ